MKVNKIGHKASQYTNATDGFRPSMAERPIRTAAYIRVSSDSDDQENSYEAQERYFTGILSSNPMLESAGIYFDIGVTGTSCKKRIGFQRLMRHCREGKIDRIICKSISRFARNAQDFITAVRDLQACGVTVYFETAGFDTSDPSTELLLTVLSALAQEESLSISQNIRDGLEHHYPLGEVRNFAIYGYRYNEKMACTENGYRYRDVDVVDEEAKVVRQIFQSVKEGRTFTDIARELNYAHVPAPQRRNESKLKSGLDEGWTASVISRLVRNERYTGDVLVRKSFTEDGLSHKQIRNKGQVSQYLICDHHAAIINREMFHDVQEILKKKNKSQGCCHRTFRPLSGVLVCGECGRNYNVRNTKLTPIWFCPTAERGNGKLTCHAEKLYERDVNETVKKAVMERMQAQHAQASHSAGYDTFYPKRQSAVPLMQQEFMQKMYEGMKVSLEDCGLEKQYTELKRRLAKAEDTEALYVRQIQEEISLLEETRSRSEASRENREKAAKWLFGFSGGKDRWAKFLDGLTGEHLKAFFELITVYQGGHFVFRWFDGTVTEVFQK